MTAYDRHIETACRLPLPWRQMDGCNVLVTGATGLIGGCLTDILMRAPVSGINVYAAGRDEARARKRFADYEANPSFHFLPLDVTSPLQGNIPYHYIIHAASNGSPAAFAHTPVEIVKANVYGVAHLMEYGLAHQMRRMLYVSSGEVYGEGDGRVFTENYSGYVDCTKARSCYPSSKRAAETLCASYVAEYGADVVIARPSHTYGPHFTETDNRVYAQFIRNVLQDEDIVMKSEGRQFRSWCYVVDCATALLYILLKGTSGEAYNIADNASNVSIRKLAELVADIGGRKVVVQLDDPEAEAQRSPVSRAVFDTSKLQALGWSIGGTLREKMAATIAMQKGK